jgi:hypothetical protein
MCVGDSERFGWILSEETSQSRRWLLRLCDLRRPQGGSGAGFGLSRTRVSGCLRGLSLEQTRQRELVMLPLIVLATFLGTELTVTG